MNIQELQMAIEQIAEEKELPSQKVFETVALALAAAYKKEYGKRGQKIIAEFTADTLKPKVYLEKIVLTDAIIKPRDAADETDDEEMYDADLPEVGEADTTEYDTKRKPRLVAADPADVAHLQEKPVRFKPQRHLMLNEAQSIFKKAALGDKVLYPLVFKDNFGRIAAQTAKQVIIQQIREIERQIAYSEYHDKEGQVVSGLVQRIEDDTVYVDLGRANGILPAMEQPGHETYRIQERLKVFVTKVEFGARGPMILLSRTHPRMLQRLFETEIPEIGNGVVLIKGIMREAGARSKVAVATTEPDIDPIGACVGQKGTRIATITNEFNVEKIDIIKWDENEAQYIANALAPAKVLAVDLNEAERKATAWVNEDQQSLAIGKGGQNVRLAAKLTGWKIDIKVKAEEQTVEAAVAADQVVKEELVAETPKEATAVVEVTQTEPKKNEPKTKKAKKPKKSKKD